MAKTVWMYMCRSDVRDNGQKGDYSVSRKVFETREECNEWARMCHSGREPIIIRCSSDDVPKGGGQRHQYSRYKVTRQKPFKWRRILGY